MRAFNRTLALLSGIALSLVVAGCGQDFQGKTSCSSNNDCLAKASTLFSDAAPVDDSLLPMCCSQVCVLPSGGCDTGYRYLTSDPGYGDCVKEDPMCPALPDMAMEEELPDMSSVD
jgi:hypothetical protein